VFNIAHTRQLQAHAAHWVIRRANPMAAKLSDKAIATRDLAQRARRLAGTLTMAADVERLLRYADELENSGG
jgi:hypothetical protein